MTSPTANAARAVKIPGSDHPINIAPHPGRVVIKAAGRIIADSRNALALREAQYPIAYYIPREDADMHALEPSPHSTYCPYKGDCSYFSIKGSETGKNAVWSYEAPYDSVAEIRNHLAFYPDRVDAIEVG